MSTPVIIEAAINGVTAPERNPAVPRSPAEIAADAVRCLAAGAAIVHSHNAEFALDGARAAERYLEAWRPVLRERPDAIFYPTAGAGVTIAERYAHEVLLAEAGVLRMGLVDPGSVNLGGADEHGLPLPIDYVYANSYRDILYEVELCARYRLGPSISIFEPGFLRVALAFQRARRLPRGALVKLYFGGDEGYLGGTGVTFGLPPSAPAWRPTSPCSRDATSPGRSRCWAGTCSPRGSRAWRSSAAATCGSASRTMRGGAARPTRSWCARRPRWSERRGGGSRPVRRPPASSGCRRRHDGGRDEAGARRARRGGEPAGRGRGRRHLPPGRLHRERGPPRAFRGARADRRAVRGPLPRLPRRRDDAGGRSLRDGRPGRVGRVPRDHARAVLRRGAHRTADRDPLRQRDPLSRRPHAGRARLLRPRDPVRAGRPRARGPARGRALAAPLS